MNRLILNPEYALKPDKGRVLLMTKDALRTEEEVVETVVHPIHAIIISFLNKYSASTAIQKASKYLNVSSNQITNFIDKITNNKKSVGVDVDDKLTLVFPPNTLIWSDKGPLDSYCKEDFVFTELELKNNRHNTPSRITFMVTTRCMTDCIYCYADRPKIENPITIERIKEIIKEAKKLNVVAFDVIGGEFFMYSNWKELLQELFKNGFNPYISTKIPITEENIIYLRETGLKDIQISLDTLIMSNSTKLLNVKESYVSQIKHSINNLTMHGIKVNIHTILTNYNSSIEDMNSIYEFIKDLKNIGMWKIDIASSTLYKAKDRFSELKIKRERLEKLDHYFNNLKEKQNQIRIVSGDLNIEGNTSPRETSYDERKKFYTRKRPIFCAANYSDIFVLPDGKVTICEELYWNPRFIIGDLSNQSIGEIWNSSKARDLYFIQKSQISEKSACHSCDIFDKCRHEYGGVCWKEIIKAYGDENWDQPDPRCLKAPNVLRDIYV